MEVRNDGPVGREVDVVHAHDIALAAPGMLRTNELYVSQYLDITPLHGDGFGTALAVRQNLAQAGVPRGACSPARPPWSGGRPMPSTSTAWQHAPGSLPRVSGGDLPSRRRQHEHTLATLQTARRRLEPASA